MRFLKVWFHFKICKIKKRKSFSYFDSSGTNIICIMWQGLVLVIRRIHVVLEITWWRVVTRNLMSWWLPEQNLSLLSLKFMVVSSWMRLAGISSWHVCTLHSVTVCSAEQLAGMLHVVKIKCSSPSKITGTYTYFLTEKTLQVAFVIHLVTVCVQFFHKINMSILFHVKFRVSYGCSAGFYCWCLMVSISH